MLNVLVTGGTGKTGSRVARRVEQGGVRARAVGRSTPVPFDWDDERTHVAALEDVSRIYLVPPLLVADPAPVITRFLDRALAAGVSRVVLLSSSAIPESSAGLGAVHRAVRERVPEWAVLQPSWFMHNFIDPGHHHAKSIADEGVLYTATGGGRIAFVDIGDIAEVAARALLDGTPHNTAHVLTGPEAMSFDEAAATITAAAGRPVRHVRLEPAEAARRMVSAGMPPAFADVLVSLDQAISQGAEDRATPTVEQVTGRPPLSLADFAADHASSWAI